MISCKMVKNTAIAGSLLFNVNMVNGMPTVYDDGDINITVDDMCEKQKYDEYYGKYYAQYNQRYRNNKYKQNRNKQYGSVSDVMKDMLARKMNENDFKILFDNCIFSDKINVSVNFFNSSMISACNQLAYMLHFFDCTNRKDTLQQNKSKIVIRGVTCEHDEKMNHLLDNIRGTYFSDCYIDAQESLNLITTSRNNCLSGLYLTTVENALYNATMDDNNLVVVYDEHIKKIIDILVEYQIINDSIAHIVNEAINDQKARNNVIHRLASYLLSYKNLASILKNK